MKKYAVIVAGGTGSRMASSVPKQFLKLHGKPILWYTVNTFLEAFDDLEIILVVAENHFDTVNDILRDMDHDNRVNLTEGGESRFHSVKNGLHHISQRSIVFVHDGVRCLLSTDLVHRCHAAALKYGNAIPAIHSVDSIRMETDRGNIVIDRETIRIIQTPQTFDSEIIRAAYEQPFDGRFTDDASLVERLGIKIHLVEGEETNIKITRPLDIIIAEKILEETRFI